MNKIDVTPKLLAELKEKAGKATKGNWFSTCDNLLQPVVNCVALDRYENRIATFEDSPYSEKDADFIASANPTVILALIAKIEQLEKEADWLAMQLVSNETLGDPYLEMEKYDKQLKWRNTARWAIKYDK